MSNNFNEFKENIDEIIISNKMKETFENELLLGQTNSLKDFYSM